MRPLFTFLTILLGVASLTVLSCSDDSTSPNEDQPSDVWARSFGGIGFEAGYDVAVDGLGNIFVVGSFDHPVTFGDTTLTSKGDDDVFVLKLSAEGELLWVRSAGGANHDAGYGLAVDDFGNVVVTGLFINSATFGDTTLTSAGVGDVFVAKYDTDGDFLWACSAGSAGWADGGNAVSVDGLGDVIVTGDFQGSATFGTSTLISEGYNDIFIAKYDSEGGFLWAHSAGGESDDRCQGVTVDDTGDAIITGIFVGSATFGDTTLTSTGNGDLFIAKYDAGGAFLWAHSTGGESGDVMMGYDVAVDGSKNIVVTGRFNGSAVFGDTTLTTLSDNDFFIAKYDASGEVLWAHSGGGTNHGDLGYGVAVDGSGNVFVTGQFVGPGTFSSIVLEGTGTYDVFLVKYDASGNLLWAEWAGTNAYDEGYGIAVNGLGYVIVTGYFAYPSISFGATELTNEGGYDIFISKTSPDGGW